jgi:hypothetical protein
METYELSQMCNCGHPYYQHPAGDDCCGHNGMFRGTDVVKWCKCKEFRQSEDKGKPNE